MSKQELSTITPGSLADQAKNNNKSLAETFLGADAVILIDVSGSMAQYDGRSSTSRYERACKELANLQQTMPGKIAVIAFSSMPTFCPGGIPSSPTGSTDLHAALVFARVADVPDMKFVVISDGEPDDEKAALREAGKYKNKINTIYIGPEGGDGQVFLSKLAAASGGQALKDFGVKMLSQNVKGLLA